MHQSNHLLSKTIVSTLFKEHDDEINNIMKETNSSFRKWNGKEFWALANECGHTSLDFNKCACKNQLYVILSNE